MNNELVNELKQLIEKYNNNLNNIYINNSCDLLKVDFNKFKNNHTKILNVEIENNNVLNECNNFNTLLKYILNQIGSLEKIKRYSKIKFFTEHKNNFLEKYNVYFNGMNTFNNLKEILTLCFHNNVKLFLEIDNNEKNTKIFINYTQI